MWRTFGKNWEILGNFGKFWEILRNFGRFCHNLRAFIWRKIEPKKYICGEKLTNMRSGEDRKIQNIANKKIHSLRDSLNHTDRKYC